MSIFRVANHKTRWNYNKLIGKHAQTKHRKHVSVGSLHKKKQNITGWNKDTLNDYLLSVARSIINTIPARREVRYPPFHHLHNPPFCLTIFQRAGIFSTSSNITSVKSLTERCFNKHLSAFHSLIILDLT